MRWYWILLIVLILIAVCLFFYVQGLKKAHKTITAITEKQSQPKEGDVCFGGGESGTNAVWYGTIINGICVRNEIV